MTLTIAFIQIHILSIDLFLEEQNIKLYFRQCIRKLKEEGSKQTCEHGEWCACE